MILSLEPLEGKVWSCDLVIQHYELTEVPTPPWAMLSRLRTKYCLCRVYGMYLICCWALVTALFIKQGCSAICLEQHNVELKNKI